MWKANPITAGTLAFLGIKQKAKTMSTENNDLLLQNADQLFDENQYQEVIDILKKHPVSFIVT